MNYDQINETPNPTTENVDVAQEAPAESKAPVSVVGVNFRDASKSYWFAPCATKVEVGDTVVVETARGLEVGRVTIAEKLVRPSEITPPLRSVLRVATPDDLARVERNRKLEKEAAVIFREKVAQHKLEMNLVRVEYTFDNSKLYFYYTAESRVDFRDLVKTLASIFKTRIDLRQIGIRDEAKMLGGIGACGRPFCCSTFLSDFAQVSIKMAKEQNFSLNSSKISGTCGRLMCCLRYEHETYEEAQKKTPSVGSHVTTPDGPGTVIETRPLAEQVRVRLDGENKDAPKFYSLEELNRPVGAPRPKPAAAETDEPAESASAPTEKTDRPRASKGEKKPKGQGQGHGHGHGQKHGNEQGLGQNGGAGQGNRSSRGGRRHRPKGKGKPAAPKGGQEG